jgi:integrase
MKLEEGIRLRPSAKASGKPSYEAFVFDPRQRRKIRKTFKTPSAARQWRKDMQAKLRVKPEEVPLHDPRQLEPAMLEWIEGCRTGAIKSRRGLNYAPATLAGYERNLRKFVFPALGTRKVANVTDRDVQTLVDELNEKGLHGRTVQNVVTPLEAFYRRNRKVVPLNPCRDIDLPDATPRKRRIASPEEALALLDALEDADVQTTYALAFLEGLRRGEVRALDGSGVQEDRIVLTHSYDETSKQRVPLKWRKAGETRVIPKPETLTHYLGELPGAGVSNNSIRRRALKAWQSRYGCGCKVLKPEGGPEPPEQCPEHKQARMEPIELHECRHSYAVWLDAAGVSNSRADRYTGHSNRTMGEHYRNHPLTSAQLAADAAALDAYLGESGGEVVALPTKDARRNR